jgi:hypothetical protein
LIAKFFCVACSHVVYSHPGEPCPVCSSPLVVIKEEPDAPDHVEDEGAPEGVKDEAPPEDEAAPQHS